MFSRLPESNARRERRAGGTVVSTIVHFVFIALAVKATAGRAAAPPELQPVPPIYVDHTPRVDRQPSTVPPSQRASSPSSILPPAPSLTPVVTIDLTATDIPVTSGAIDLTVRADDFRAPGTLGGSGDSTGAPNVSGGQPLAAGVVDQVIIALPGTEPRYPSMLRSAGVEGDVRAQFVVDTLGRVEQGSIRVLETTHDLFAAAVREALARARFKAAEAGGHKVRQLAEQVFTFRISH